MKKILLTAAITAGLSILAFNANASHSNKNTISLGYAQSNGSLKNNIEIYHNDKKMSTNQHGLNLKYRYEFNEHFGVISSLTYTQNVHKYDYYGSSSKFEWKNTSLMAGPTYRFNDYISAYGLIGATHSKVGISDAEVNNFETKTSLSYGAGLQFNPASNWAVDASYSYTNLKYAKLGTWVLGVGYRF
ncbi:Ail/Lom family outer membrane beta-barrel protein [Xenorhabdus sp. XENO-10]|uniref:Ail/Lom family outer membrane beta-barrel protein n=1 Tax=Xenorhabdus yunnanensis TaxID=3025878 RepID=A0ABT5LGC1_9GAMM|nr:Ail/Lom family outer membrane beta-barrel protein [Xenorhabdus yunnanensis]MDC9590152.1 Ail/Lom family outer membrane beta-barrel protein [Xenorhabdus yunnanensis]